MSPIHQVWPKPSCKAQWKGEEDKADWGRGGKTTSGSGQAWSSAGPRGQWRTGKNGEGWLRNHLWCPNDSRGFWIDDDDDNGDDCQSRVYDSFNVMCGFWIDDDDDNGDDCQSRVYDSFNVMLRSQRNIIDGSVAVWVTDVQVSTCVSLISATVTVRK